jgi:hypothetical protein
VAQSVFWARTDRLDLGEDTLMALLKSEVQIEEGLIDGLFAEMAGEGNDGSSGNVITWGAATHVSCYGGEREQDQS